MQLEFSIKEKFAATSYGRGFHADHLSHRNEAILLAYGKLIYAYGNIKRIYATTESIHLGIR